MKTQDNKYVRIMVITIVLLIAVTAAYVLYIKNASDNVRVFDADSDEVSIEVFNPEGKIWEDMYRYPGHPCGAEYSVNVYNYSRLRLSDWTITIVFDGPFEIDSSWNGVFEADENTLTFTPEGELVFVEPENSRYFGAVLYSRYLLNVESFEITGRMPLDPFAMPLTYIIAVLYVLWMLYVGSHILANARIESLLKQRAHDLQMIDQSIRTFTSFIDAKDSYTRNHSLRVAIYAKEIGRRIGLDDDKLQDLYYETLLHDVGKIGIPDEILRNKGSLNDEEYKTIKTHTGKGKEMLKDFTAVSNIFDAAYYHHERFDGTGYPEGLKGEQIPLCARIASIADAYDAMSSDRRYRKSLSREKTIEEFKENSGTQFDPELVPVIISMIEDGFTDRVLDEYGQDGED
ncbi:MAG: HD domain-containing protein [Clostridiales bacterium]|nr:HD domain-containing protein [Clostridiales bacterium]